MKQFIISIIITLIAANAGFAQTGKKARFFSPLVAEEPIRHIIVTGNIDVLLMEDVPANIGVRLPSPSLDKITVRLEGDHLFLSASSKLADGERASAYVTVNDLNSLELKGNVVATSKGVLESQQLKLITNENAVVALRSDGPIMVASPSSYQVVKEKRFYSVYAGVL